MVSYTDDIASILREMILIFHSNEEFELEASVRITNGIPFNVFKTIHHALQKTTKVDCKLKTIDPIKYIDLYSDNNIRTRSFIGHKYQHIRKECVQTIDCNVIHRPGIEIRIVLKREIPIELLSESVISPNFVRVCQRWSFNYNNEYRYDLTKIGTGNDKVAACDSPLTYEIELELQHTNNHSSIDDIINSFTAKILDLCGRYRVTDTGVVEEDKLILACYQ